MAQFFNQWKGLVASYNVVEENLLVRSCGYLKNVTTYSSFGSSTLGILGIPLLKILGLCHFDVVLAGELKNTPIWYQGTVKSVKSMVVSFYIVASITTFLFWFV